MKVGERGRVTIPKKIRDRYGLRRRSRVCRWVVRTGKNTGDKIAGATAHPPPYGRVISTAIIEV
jgi:bifunctional DNA-binding transcriptional regulator/antitoxin component of YhaV-PrlF toxin-antitoxin module